MSPDTKVLIAHGALCAAEKSIAGLAPQLPWMDKADRVRQSLDAIEHAANLLKEAEKEYTR